jgi:polyhydroxyalkanoate synthesis regulator phasin
MLKDILYTGIGAVTILKDKIEEEMKKLEDSGKIKRDDAKSFMDSLITKGKESDDELKTKIKDTIKEVIDELGIATKDDILKLKEDLASKS